MIKNIIFDWSGVVSDNVQDVYKTVTEIIRRGRGRGISFEEFRLEWVSPYMKFYRKFLPELQVEEQKKHYLEIFATHNTNKPHPGVVELLKTLHKAGIKMTLLSSDHPSYLHDEIAEFGLTEVFKEVYGDVHDKTTVIKGLIKKHHFDPAESLFVGDTQNDDEAGKHAGLKTALVTWGFCTKAAIELCEPDYIIETPEELKKLIIAEISEKV
jgi:phosphoglycolate phosphatase